MEGKGILELAIVVGLVAVVGTIMLYVAEEVDDTAAIVSGDTYFDALDNLSGGVTTGYSLVPVMVLIAVLSMIIGALGLKAWMREALR